jgi:hypothetical protein
MDVSLPNLARRGYWSRSRWSGSSSAATCEAFHQKAADARSTGVATAFPAAQYGGTDGRPGPPEPQEIPTAPAMVAAPAGGKAPGPAALGNV